MTGRLGEADVAVGVHGHVGGLDLGLCGGDPLARGVVATGDQTCRGEAVPLEPAHVAGAQIDTVVVNEGVMVAQRPAAQLVAVSGAVAQLALPEPHAVDADRAAVGQVDLEELDVVEAERWQRELERAVVRHDHVQHVEADVDGAEHRPPVAVEAVPGERGDVVGLGVGELLDDGLAGDLPYELDLANSDVDGVGGDDVDLDGPVVDVAGLTVTDVGQRQPVLRERDDLAEGLGLAADHRAALPLAGVAVLRLGGRVGRELGDDLGRGVVVVAGEVVDQLAHDGVAGLERGGQGPELGLAEPRGGGVVSDAVTVEVDAGQVAGGAVGDGEDLEDDPVAGVDPRVDGLVVEADRNREADGEPEEVVGVGGDGLVEVDPGGAEGLGLVDAVLCGVGVLARGRQGGRHRGRAVVAHGELRRPRGVRAGQDLLAAVGQDGGGGQPGREHQVGGPLPVVVDLAGGAVRAAGGGVDGGGGAVDLDQHDVGDDRPVGPGDLHGAFGVDQAVGTEGRGQRLAALHDHVEPTVGAAGGGAVLGVAGDLHSDAGPRVAVTVQQPAGDDRAVLVVHRAGVEAGLHRVGTLVQEGDGVGEDRPPGPGVRGRVEDRDVRVGIGVGSSLAT